MDHRIIEKKLEILQGLATETTLPIAGWVGRTAEYLAAEEYHFTGDWAPTALPVQIVAGQTVFLKARLTVPESVPLASSFLTFSHHGWVEGLLILDGEPYAGLDGNHHRVPLPRHGTFEVALELTAHTASYYRPELAGETGTLFAAGISVVSRDIEALSRAVRFAWDTARVITDPRRKALLEAAVEDALLAVDLTLPRERLLGEVAQARRIFDEKLAAIHPDPEAGSIFAVGHTHIDTAWLWPLKETVRKCGRSFSTACRLMEQYPEFHFTCSQPQLYQYTRQYYPAVYRQIKHWVAEGRWETAGAMWVEADCNVTSGESLVRQMLYGIDFFQREFGTRPRICWLPDVFGYPSSLPEIFAGCGIEYFYTYKLHWQATNPFPDHLFRWRGLDGSEVLAHVVNHLGAYNNDLCPEHLAKGWEMYAQKAEYPEVIFPFGYGDGGGGVTEGQMENLRLANGHYPGLPAVRIGTAQQFFDDVVAADPALPVWDGELYVETHRGTYTTQSEMKRANRVSELLLREAEIWGALAQATGARDGFDAATLRPAWEKTLLYQFHDILPGSSIGMVYEDALAEHARLQASVRQVRGEQLAALAPAAQTPDALCVFNALSWPRHDPIIIEVPDRAEPVSVVAADGHAYPAQVVARREGRATLVCQPGEVPALGYAAFTLSSVPAIRTSELVVSETALENRFFYIELNAEGGLTRIYDKRRQREVLAPGMVGNDLQLLQDGPEGEDAWNVHPTIDKRRYPFEGPTTVRVQETGPVRGSVRVTRAHRDSILEQDIVLYADSPRIDFVTRVDWQERQTMLKVAFPVEIRSTRATYEVQFGAYARSTTRNTSWETQQFEVPGQRWVDLSEAGYGVSLLNDARYGFDVKENVLRLTLLRSTIFPDPEADRGTHEFTYALLPHDGDWTTAETVRHAWELNVPAQAVIGCRAAEPAHSFLTLDGPAILEALKPAENGHGLIVRLYEPHGSRGEVTLTPCFPVRQVTACNLVEEDGEHIPLRDGRFTFAMRPFQIRTFRLA